MKKLTLLVALALTCCLLPGGTAAAQDSEELAKAAQNPLATMVTLPLQTNFNLGVGPYDRQIFNLNVQPVVPFKGEKWNVISRTIIPVNSVPVGETDSVFGIGDINMTLFWSPAKAGTVTWGVGPVFGLPTASNPEVLGSEKFGLGPSAVLFYQTGKWTMGGLVSNIWSVAGDGARDDYNLLTLMPFLNFNFGGGLALGMVPTISADWNADSDNRWTVPLGLQISKVTRFGAQPVNLLAGYYSNVEHPDGAADSQVRLQVNFMFPVKN